MEEKGEREWKTQLWKKLRPVCFFAEKQSLPRKRQRERKKLFSGTLKVPDFHVSQRPLDSLFKLWSKIRVQILPRVHCCRNIMGTISTVFFKRSKKSGRKLLKAKMWTRARDSTTLTRSRWTMPAAKLQTEDIESFEFKVCIVDVSNLDQQNLWKLHLYFLLC
jgi:hypothetical protein